MAKVDTLVLLVNSLTKAEKRVLNLARSKGADEKDYQILYRLLQSQQGGGDEVKKAFLKFRPKASFDLTCHYLYHYVVQKLIAYEAEQDVENQLLDSYRECKVLVGRGLHDECFKLIAKCRTKAESYEKFDLCALFDRLELQLLNQFEFWDYSEEELVRRMGKLELAVKKQRAIDNHYSLYHLIRHRQFNQGPTRTEREKEKLNDLAFNELQANVGLLKDSYEARKVHLLFQSSYFWMTANPRSSLKVYFELNDLFESHKRYWNSPPILYLEHLRGILNNLRLSGRFEDIPHFIDKAKAVVLEDSRAKLAVAHLRVLFESYLLTDQKEYAKAWTHLQENQSILTELKAGLSVASYAELQLQSAFVCHKNGLFREAIKELAPLMNLGRTMAQLPSYNAVRLLMVMIRYDMGDFEYLSYEIRSFERDLKNKSGLRKSEALMLKTIKKLLLTNDPSKRRATIESCQQELSILKRNANEWLYMVSLDMDGWLAQQV